MAGDGARRRTPRFVRVRRRAGQGRAPAAATMPQASAVETRAPTAESERHTRIVIPRQERRSQFDSEHSDADVELREVRYGQTSHMPYLRVVPRQRRLVRVGPGHIQATALGSRPVDVAGRYWADIKRVVIGSPYATSQAIHERLSKTKALAIFSSDALSSSAYATEEILLVLTLAGTAVLVHALPIAGVIALLLAIVTLSYRQTIKAYPSGGGAYIVAHENLGKWPGLLAAAAIMVDYVLTVSVSVAAGVAAVTSALPGLYDVRVPIGVAIIALMTLGNLRGIREAGTLFAVPTYWFIVSMSVVVVAGMVKVAIGDSPGSLFNAGPPREEIVAVQGLSLFLVLKAFSSGSAALTGIEAISNGVPSFKQPEVKNARITMIWMAGILTFLFLGITFLCNRFGLVPTHQETIVSQLGREVLGENVLYYSYQVATALVLFLAANTSYNAFPRVAAILAEDKFMPRQFAFKGDRLAYSNGIILLAITASVLLIVYTGEVSKLIPLYAVGVFVSFTLSQAGMVRRFWRSRESGWQGSMIMSGVGAVATAVVAMIIGGTKFLGGAWISIIMMLGLIALFAFIRHHYDWFEGQLRLAGQGPLPRQPSAQRPDLVRDQRHVVVPVDSISRVSMESIAHATELSGRVTAVYITDDIEQAEEFREEWQAAVPDVPLLVIESPYRAFVTPLLAYIESLKTTEPGPNITVVLPRFVTRHWWERFLHNQDILRLRSYLRKRSPDIEVVEIPYRLEDSLVVDP